MIRSLFHPSLSWLKRFADGGADRTGRQRVARHIAACPSCRDRIAEFRALTASARALGNVQAPPQLLGAIHARLTAGDRVILPVDWVPVPAARRWPVAAAVVLLVASMAAWVFWPSSDLAAGPMSGDLAFTPAHPPTGAWIDARYDAPPRLAEERVVVLRARFRTPRDIGYEFTTHQVVAAMLRRTSRGVFEGRFRLPDSVVYGAFAIETPGGHAVDSNGRQLWELLVSTADGRPTFDALTQRMGDLQGRNWELALQVAREQAGLYPDSPEAWANLHFYEWVDLGRSYLDSTVESDRVRLRAFQQRYGRDGAASPQVTAGMYHYAVALDDSALAASWRGRLRRDTSNALPALQLRLLDISATVVRDSFSVRASTEALKEGEALWERHHPLFPGIFEQNMIGFAEHAKDTAAVLRWVDRFATVWQDSPVWAFALLVRYPTLRDTGIARLRATARALATVDDAKRALEQTFDEQLQANRAPMRRALVSLGSALLAKGDTLSGLDTLRLAASEGWDPALFRQVATALLAAKDTAAASLVLALAAADPATSVQSRDSIRRALGPGLDSNRWVMYLENARLQMRSRILEDAVQRRMRSEVRLLGPNGDVVNLADVLRGRTTLVVFWSRQCGPAVLAVPDILRVKDVLARSGARVVAVTDEPESPELRSFLSKRPFDVPLYHDVWRQAGSAFQNAGTPMYFVVDASGTTRFAYTDLKQVPAEVAVLQGDGGRDPGGRQSGKRPT